MEDNALISIIVPVYKVEQYLPKCIDSLLVQTYDHFEVLLIDDGSPDNCPEICDRYAAQDARVRVFHKQNGGQSSARNLGLDHSRGEYIAFVDSDDYVSPFYLERLYQRITADKTDFAVCGYQEVEQSVHDHPKTITRDDGVVGQENAWYWETEGFYMLAVALWNKLFKAELWKELRLVDGKYAEDSFAFTYYMKHAKTVSIISEPLYFYVQRGDSNVHDYSVKNLDSVEARLERAAYHLASGRDELARTLIMQISHQMYYACERLDMTELAAKIRYEKLAEEYKALYHRAGCRFELSKTGIKSAAFAKADRVAGVVWKAYRSVRRSLEIKNTVR